VIDTTRSRSRTAPPQNLSRPSSPTSNRPELQDHLQLRSRPGHDLFRFSYFQLVMAAPSVSGVPKGVAPTDWSAHCARNSPSEENILRDPPAAFPLTNPYARCARSSSLPSRRCPGIQDRAYGAEWRRTLRDALDGWYECASDDLRLGTSRIPFCARDRRFSRDAVGFCQAAASVGGSSWRLFARAGGHRCDVGAGTGPDMERTCAAVPTGLVPPPQKFMRRWVPHRHRQRCSGADDSVDGRRLRDDSGARHAGGSPAISSSR